MFLVNSRYRHFTATPFRSRSKSFHVMGAHLLPKLRCQFAEFLNQSSLTRLGILTLPTCVGFRYGRHKCSTRSFSRKHGIGQFESPRARPHPLSALHPRLCLSTPTGTAYRVEPEIRYPDGLSFFVPARFNTAHAGAGILTCLPSTTPFGLVLGPD